MAVQRFLMYALGGGFGHLTRACGLARAGLPDIQIRILTNSPYAGIVKRVVPEVELIALDPGMSVDQGRVEVPHQITSAKADGLIVDTFPRGLGGELATVIATFSGLKVFVRRDLNPHYVRKYNLQAFIENSYDLVLAPGDETRDCLGPFPQTLTTAPWLVRTASEMLPRERARQFLGLSHERPCVIVCAAGNPEELAWYGAVVSQFLAWAPECDIRCIAPVRPDGCPPACWIDYWPAMELYNAADVMIGGAGYNTVYEAAACGVPLIARAWPRKYDRQNLRVRHAARIAGDAGQAVNAALELLREGQPRERLLHFENGVVDAIARIRQMTHESSKRACIGL